MTPSVKSLLLSLAAVVLSAFIPAHATITIVNADGAGEGLNDTTVVSPVGGNTATTIGDQRLNVFNRAAAILNATFDITQPVRVSANFDPLACNSSSATLGSAGPAQYHFLYDSGTSSYTVYPDALGNQLSNTDLDAGTVDINANFNSELGKTGCLDGYGWYLGYDAPTGTLNSLLSVVLHEIMHGMGFLSLLQSNGVTGATYNSDPVYDPYTQLLYDGTQGALLTALNDTQRAAAILNDGNLLWDGAQTNAQLSGFSAGVSGGRMQMYAPASYENGSSVSHFDTDATPNELMEPQYTEFLNTAGLAQYVLADIGWTLNTSNSAPVMTAISDQSLNEDGTLDVTLSASDADGDALTYAITSAATEFGASISGSTLSFSPDANYNGSGTVTVQVSDGVATDSASFTLTINAVNDAPVITAISDQNVDEDGTLSVTLAASDVDGDSLSYSVTSAASEFGASITGNTLSFSPDANYSGSGTVTVEVTDGTATDSASFTLTVNAVNDAPVIAVISNQNLDEDGTLDVTLSATDTENDTLIFSIVSAAADFGASISGTTLSFAPAADYNGSGTVTVQVSDGAAADSTSFTLTVNAVNDAPVMATSTDHSVTEGGTPLAITLTATDSDGDSLTFSLDSYDAALISASLSGTTLTINPDQNASGATTVDVSVSDGNLTANATLNINVLAADNEAPVWDDPAAVTLMAGGTDTITLSASDPDANPLTYSLTSVPAALTAVITDDTLALSADVSASGSYNLGLSVTDGALTDTSTLSVTVLPAFSLTTRSASYQDGDTLSAGLSDLNFALSGGDDELTATLFYNGADASDLLSVSSGNYVLAMPLSGAFAGDYTLSVSDNSGHSATFYLERPLRLNKPVLPLLIVDGSSQTLMIEGAVAASGIGLASSNPALTFADASGNTISTVSAADDADNFNATTVTLMTAATADFSSDVTLSATNVPDTAETLTFSLPKEVQFSVTDISLMPLQDATVSVSDDRFSVWNLSSSATTASDGTATLQMPAETLSVLASADGYQSKTVSVGGAETNMNIQLSESASAFTVSGIVQASGFDFLSEMPVLIIYFTDGSREILEVTSINSTSVRYRWEGDLSVKVPSYLSVNHSASMTVDSIINTEASEQSLNVTLINLNSAAETTTVVVTTTSSSSSSGGAFSWLLLVLLSVVTSRRRRQMR
ncbi:MAG: hypothetical protein CMI02_12310 [Oceanospirillaceae bacterium]|nr:hypothetical protein [Oceanospirillaceae bacterium]MBT12804.1 hypothetical protein [Oceanospirillaceae bacterium]|tara:strand:- start:43873 stop:47418 length:3546 start_codon:yes stop_codon:yes gene_type:complete